MDENDNTMNPYLALRAAKIARNEARLKELGLWKPAPPPPKPTIHRRRRRSTSPVGSGPENDKRQKKKEVDATKLNNGCSHRRSQRLMKQTSKPNYVDDSISTTTTTTRTAIRSTADGWNHTDDSVLSARPAVSRKKNSLLVSTSSSQSSSSETLNVKPNSVRLIKLDPHLLVKHMLGKNLDETGKDYVIHESFRIAASLDDWNRLGYNPTSDPMDVVPHLSFNKYSGVQEWKNNVIFLWVNLNSNNPTADANVVHNEFLTNGRQITWFGGSRMDDNSPIIQSLIRIGKKTTSKATSSSTAATSQQQAEGKEDGEAIVLWCRQYDKSTKTFSPYVCFGRMGYHSHVVGSYPVSFVWNLIDYDELVMKASSNNNNNNNNNASSSLQIRDMLMIS
jgi:hypothetical protein